MSNSALLTKAQVEEMFGWSPTTIWRKVKQNCFPCYRLTYNDVRFKTEEILHYIEGKRNGSFDEKGAPHV